MDSEHLDAARPEMAIEFANWKRRLTAELVVNKQGNCLITGTLNRKHIHEIEGQGKETVSVRVENRTEDDDYYECLARGEKVRFTVKATLSIRFRRV
jgi:hypothetical protein